MTLLMGLLAAACYGAAAATAISDLRHARAFSMGYLSALGGVGLLLHGWVLFDLMWQPNGLNLGLFDVASLVAWLALALVLIATRTLPVANLLLVLFPLSAVTVLMSLFLYSNYRPGPVPVPAHVVPSLLAYSVLFLAAIQAVVLAFQERRVRHARSLPTLRMLPPLQSMEQLLFQLLWVGLALLSIAVVTGLMDLDNMSEQRVVHHTVLSLMSWLVFAVLLWGRHTLGWRGSIAIRWTLAGFVVLALAYFGSKFVIELVLQP